MSVTTRSQTYKHTNPTYCCYFIVFFTAPILMLHHMRDFFHLMLKNTVNPKTKTHFFCAFVLIYSLSLSLKILFVFFFFCFWMDFKQHTCNYTYYTKEGTDLVCLSVTWNFCSKQPVHFSGVGSWLQLIPLAEKASTSFGKSFESIILKPVELPFWQSSSVVPQSTAHPTGAPSMYALQAVSIWCARRVKCSSTRASKCCKVTCLLRMLSIFT